MGYVNKRDRENAIIKVKIEFGTQLNCEHDEDATITLREPTELEVLKWREAHQEGDYAAMAQFKELITDMTISHNLMEDENEKMTNEAVIDLIFSKTGLAEFVLQKWTDAVFRSPQNRKEGK